MQSEANTAANENMTLEEQQELGYMPLRDDFERVKTLILLHRFQCERKIISNCINRQYNSHIRNLKMRLKN